jgi:hypothetical protein
MYLICGMNFISVKYYPVREVSDLIFFLRKPGGFQCSALALGNLELSYKCVKFSRLSIAPVDGKQNLSEVVFSALVGFSLLEKISDLWVGNNLAYLKLWKPNTSQNLVF